MNRLGTFALGMAVGAVCLFFVMHYYLVRATDGFHMVPKVAAKLETPYVDIRNYKLGAWQKKQSLAVAILRVNKGYLISDQSLLGFKQTAQQMLDQYSTTQVASLGR